MKMASSQPKLVGAVDESGAIVCAYTQDAKTGSYQAVVRLPLPPPLLPILGRVRRCYRAG